MFPARGTYLDRGWGAMALDKWLMFGTPYARKPAASAQDAGLNGVMRRSQRTATENAAGRAAPRR
jgi:hypothetical protein